LFDAKLRFALLASLHSAICSESEATNLLATLPARVQKLVQTMVVGVSNQRVENQVLTRFYAGEQFPFSQIYGFGGTDKFNDVHLTFKE
jgi:hypothetical protein